MIRKILLLLLLPTTAIGQEFYTPSEYGVMVGASTYFGDLNPNYGMRFIRPATGVFYRYSINPYISIKGMANYTRLGYDDQLTANPYQKQRNLRFKSDIVELAAMSEFNFHWFQTGVSKRRFTPYLAAGVGVFYYEPFAYHNNKKYNLRNLGTEGQNTKEYKDRKYKPVSVCFPVGAGIKYWITPGFNLGVEILNRFTLTDYLDDVSQTYVGADKFPSSAQNPTAAYALQDPSILVEGQKLGRAGKQRGDNSTKDQYIMIQVSMSFQLKTYKCPPRFDAGW